MIEKYVEIKCDRCSRVIKTVSDDKVLRDEVSEGCKECFFYANLDGCILEYVHLCDSCKKRIGSLFNAMEPTKKSRMVKKTNKED